MLRVSQTWVGPDHLLPWSDTALLFWHRSQLFHWPPSQRRPGIIRFLFPEREKKKKRKKEKGKTDGGALRITIYLEKKEGAG